MLNSLELFFHEVEPEVDRMGAEGEGGLSLMCLMAIFNKVRESRKLKCVYDVLHTVNLFSLSLLTIFHAKVNAQQVEMDKKFGAVHRAFAMLEKFSHPLPKKPRDQFSAAPHRSAPAPRDNVHVLINSHIHDGNHNYTKKEACASVHMYKRIVHKEKKETLVHKSALPCPFTGGLI